MIRGITFTQYAYRALEVEGKRQLHRDEEPTDEPVGLADPATYGKEVVGTTLENVTITYCSRVAGYFRGDGLIIRHSPRQRHQHRGHLRHRLVRRAAGAEHLPPQQRRAAHRLLPRRGQDLQPVPPRHLPRQPGHRQPELERHLVRRRQRRRRLRQQLGRGRARRLLLRDLEGRDRAPATCSCAATRASACSTAPTCASTTTRSSTPPASFERNERSAAGDHFGWHPATGPDVDKREGHVFVGNLLVGRARRSASRCCASSSRRPCARKLTRPQVTQVDGNVYVRRRTRRRPAARSCGARSRARAARSSSASLEDLRPAAAGVRGARPRLRDYAGALFRSPELATTSWPSVAGPAAGGRPAGRGGEAARLAGGRAADAGRVPAPPGTAARRQAPSREVDVC